MRRYVEKEYDRLCDELDDHELEPHERKAIEEELREMEREAAEESRWREEGEERGWF